MTPFGTILSISLNNEQFLTISPHTPGVGTVSLGSEFGLYKQEDPDPNSTEMQFLRHILRVFSGVNDSEMGIHTWHYIRNPAFIRLQRADRDFSRYGQSVNEMMRG